MDNKKLNKVKLTFYLMLIGLVVTNSITAKFFANNEVISFENINGIFTLLRVEPRGVCRPEELELSNLISEVYHGE